MCQFLIFESEGLFLEGVDRSNIFFNVDLKLIKFDQEKKVHILIAVYNRDIS